jgi:hypothetical protein
MDVEQNVAQLADRCAARLQGVVAADAAVLEPDFRNLLDAVRELDPRFEFDRDGRPGAIAAIRGALPLLERELLDAIIEDHAAELAAVHEAMFRVMRAMARRSDAQDEGESTGATGR